MNYKHGKSGTTTHMIWCKMYDDMKHNLKEGEQNGFTKRCFIT